MRRAPGVLAKDAPGATGDLPPVDHADSLSAAPLRRATRSSVTASTTRRRYGSTGGRSPATPGSREPRPNRPRSSRDPRNSLPCGHASEGMLQLKVLRRHTTVLNKLVGPSEERASGLGDGRGVDAVVSVEIATAARLAEGVDAEGELGHGQRRAEEGEAVGMAIEHGDDRHVFLLGTHQLLEVGTRV